MNSQIQCKNDGRIFAFVVLKVTAIKTFLLVSEAPARVVRKLGKSYWFMGSITFQNGNPSVCDCLQAQNYSTTMICYAAS